MPLLTTQAGAYQRAAGRYSGDAVSTASPAKLVVLLYDRLVLDLARARQAQLDGKRPVANENLIHAQDIVAELLSSLDVTAWDGAPQLSRLYSWLIAEMVRANVSGDHTKTKGCLDIAEELLAKCAAANIILDIAEELRQAWTEAEVQLSAARPTSTRPTSSGLTSVGLTG